MSIETALPSEMMDTIELARDLIRLDTANPPGNESVIADLIESRLAKLGIVAVRHAHASGRDSLVARLNGERAGKPICFCGHIDTVPVGTIQWRLGALDGTIEGGRLWGRGATDMKSGVAAMVTAFERLAVDGCDSNVMLLLCASEETGCQGAANVAKHIEKAGAVVISEPTSNNLAIGHKGVLWVKLSTVGVAAHGSMPHLGVNAINRMAEAIVGLRGLEFGVTEHQLLGLPTLNVGLIRGGSAPNMVPDYCECTVDIA